MARRPLEASENKKYIFLSSIFPDMVCTYLRGETSSEASEPIIYCVPEPSPLIPEPVAQMIYNVVSVCPE